MTLETFTSTDERARSWLGLDNHSQAREDEAMNLQTHSNGLGLGNAYLEDILTGDEAILTENDTYVVFTPSGRFIAEVTLAALLAKGYKHPIDSEEV